MATNNKKTTVRGLSPLGICEVPEIHKSNDYYDYKQDRSIKGSGNASNNNKNCKDLAKCSANSVGLSPTCTRAVLDEAEDFPAYDAKRVSDASLYDQIRAGSKKLVFFDNSAGENKYFFFEIRKCKIVSVTKKRFSVAEGTTINVRGRLVKFFHGSRAENASILSKIDWCCICSSAITCYKAASCIADFTGESFITDIYEGGVTLLSILRSIARVKTTSLSLQVICCRLSSILCRLGSNEFSLSTLCSLLLDALSVYLDLDNLRSLWVGESGASVENLIKKISLLSNFKLLDDVNGLYKIFETFLCLIDYVCDLTGNEVLRVLYKKLLSFGNLSNWLLIRTLNDIYKQWYLNRRIVLEDSFREKVFRLNSELALQSVYFADWRRKSGGVANILDNFKRVVSIVESYNSSSRVEPVCFIFEGPPGCMKSTIMSKLIGVTGKSSYSHCTKTSESGKDFYDSYNNEEIFYSDDMGAQGVSQWRMLINLVSSVKLPLDCASADLKDTKFFTSSNIFLTTNHFSDITGVLRSDGIGDLHALWRRGFVFDFKQVTRVGDCVVGTIKFKHFCPFNKKWVYAFPHDFLEHMSTRETVIPDSFTCTVDNQLDLLAWLFAIVQNFNKIRETYSIKNTLTKEDNEFIRQRANLMYRSESNVLVDFWNIIVETICTFIDDIDIFAAIKEKPLKILSTCLLPGVLYYGLKNLKKLWNSNSVSTQAKPDFLYVNNITGVHSLVTKISQQVYYAKFSYQDDDKATVDNHASAILSNRFVVTVSHVCRKDEAFVTLYKDYDKNHILVDNRLCTCVWRDVEGDIAIFSLGNSYPTPFKDIRLTFNREGKFPKFMVTPNGVLDISGLICGGVKMPTPYSIKVNKCVIENLIHPQDIFYKYHGTGLCGSPILDEDGVFLGMHVAGSIQSGTGVALNASVLTKAKLHGYLAPCGQSIESAISPKVIPNFSGIKLDTGFETFTPKKSNFVPSPIHGVFPIERQPANLSVYGPHTVKDVGKKSFKPVNTVPMDELKFATSIIEDYVPFFEPLSMKETILGTEYLAGINKKSSNGYGYPADKHEYIDFVNGELRPSFKETFENVQRQLKEGTLPDAELVWVETLKDELRSISKHEPRSFRVSSICNQLMTKQVFGRFVENIIQQRDFNGIMIGINPYKDWPKLFDKLKLCKEVWAGDIGSWDGCMLPQVQQLINRVLVSRFRGDKHYAAQLLDLIPNTMVVMNDDTYLTTHSMPSGSFLTAIYNSLVNKFYTAMWFYRNLKFAKINLRQVFHTSVLDFAYGDDKVNGLVTMEYKDKLNAITMREFFESLGMKFTDSLKKPIVQPFQTLSEITFLKRSFRWHSVLEQVTCPLELSTICSSIQWVDKSKDIATVFLDKINAFQREAFLHEEAYEDLVNTVLSKCTSSGVLCPKLPINYLTGLYKSGNYASDSYLFGIAVGEVDTTYNRLDSSLGTDIAEQIESIRSDTLVGESDAKQSTMNTVETREENHHSDLRTKRMEKTNQRYPDWPKLTSVPSSLRMVYDRIHDKPFFVKNVAWGTTDTKGTFVGNIEVPTDLLVNSLIKVPFAASCYYRCKICLMFQVAATPMHQGTVLASAIPRDTGVDDYNQLIIPPHAFLSANESSSICVEVPFYSALGVKRTPFTSRYVDKINYASVRLYVLNPLLAPATGSTNVTISVHAIIKDAEFYVPKLIEPTWQAESWYDDFYKIPTSIFNGLADGAKRITGDFIDASRNLVRAYTGFHNPNMPAIVTRMIQAPVNFANNVDQPNLFEKLDQHAQFNRITYDTLFDTKIDEMEVSHILSKPAFISSFTVTDSDVVGTRLMTRPITPFLEADADDAKIYTPMRLLYESSLAWRGSLKLHIQSVMSNFQFLKLIVVKTYGNEFNTNLQYPDLSSAQNLLTDTLEFSAGGQIQTVELPYCSVYEQLPCTKDVRQNGFSHGLFHIYVLQPLVTNGTVANSATFNVYMSAGDDFEFYGYSNDTLIPLNPVAAENASNNLELSRKSKAPDTISGSLLRAMIKEEAANNNADDAVVIKFAAESEVTVAPSDQNDLINPDFSDKTEKGRCVDFKPMRSLRDYIRRMVNIKQGIFTPMDNAIPPYTNDQPLVATISLRDLWHDYTNRIPLNMHMRKMFYGYTGGLKIRIIAKGAETMRVKYIPPNVSGDYVSDYEKPTDFSTTGDPSSVYVVNAMDRETLTTVASVSNSTPYMPIQVAKSNSSSVSPSMCISEFVIPNMNAARFITSIYTGNAAYTSDFGDLVFSLVGEAEKTVGELRVIYYSIDVGFTDETRLGQHCFNEGLAIPFVADATSGEVYRTQSDFNGSLHGPQVSVINLPGFYYTKP